MLHRHSKLYREGWGGLHERTCTVSSTRHHSRTHCTSSPFGTQHCPWRHCDQRGSEWLELALFNKSGLDTPDTLSGSERCGQHSRGATHWCRTLRPAHPRGASELGPISLLHTAAEMNTSNASTSNATFINSPTANAVGALSSAVAVLLSLVHVFLHLRNFTKPNVQLFVVRLLLAVPVYAIGSAVSLYIAGTTTIAVETIRDIYESFVIYSFLSYLLVLSGGENNCVCRIAQQPGSIRHPWPLCKLRPIPLGSRFLRYCKQGALQFVVIKPVCAVVALVMLATGNSEAPAYRVTVVVVYNISYTVALYALCEWERSWESGRGGEWESGSTGDLGAAVDAERQEHGRV